jgi:hypothetical protein
VSIVESGYKIEAQAKPFTAIAVRPTQDPEPLKPTDHMFGGNALACQLPIGLLLFRRERMMLAFLCGVQLLS